MFVRLRLAREGDDMAASIDVGDCRVAGCGYLLAKGDVSPTPISDVIDFEYTGNRLHPTQKPTQALRPLVEAFSKPGAVVLDPFCGSGSTLVAAQELGRDYFGIELDAGYHATATNRLRAVARAA